MHAAGVGTKRCGLWIVLFCFFGEAGGRGSVVILVQQPEPVLKDRSVFTGGTTDCVLHSLGRTNTRQFAEAEVLLKVDGVEERETGDLRRGRAGEGEVQWGGGRRGMKQAPHHTPTPIVPRGAERNRAGPAGSPTGRLVALWEITLFKQMECEQGLPYANKARLISPLPAVQFKMSPPCQGAAARTCICVRVS